MLIRFSVQNFLSFKFGVSLNLQCAPITEHEDSHTFEYGPYKLLKSAVIYGQNGSGKSNLLSGMNFMKDFILNSSKESNATEDIEVSPFRLSTQTENDPSIFEIEFLLNERVYRYGFSVDYKKIHEEWLYYLPYKEKKKEIQLFARKNGEIEINDKTEFIKEGKGLEDKTRENALFLSVVANFNGKTALEIINWIEDLDLMSGTRNQSLGFTARMIKQPKLKSRILKLLKAADFGIEDILVEEIQIERKKLPSFFSKELLDKIKSAEILYSIRKKYDENENDAGFEMFDFADLESEGTKKFLALVGPIIDKLEKGGVLVIDELDAKMHPLMTRKIVELFNSYDINRKNAQLIYATHDATNLSNKQFRRDQVWFVDKDLYGSSTLYSLVEYRENKKVRKDASYGKDYLLGKYGGIPNFRSWKVALEESDEDA